MAPAADEVVAKSISPYGIARSTVAEKPLDAEELRKYDAWFRASMYLCLGMLYLRDNPLLKEPLKVEHLKARLLGHWGSDAGQAFTWMHFNRLITKYNLDALFVSGPGHGAPAVLSQSYLEGVYSEVYPDKSETEEGMRRFFKQFSFPGGVGSHATPETPGSIHEGGELGYSISHAFGTAFDHPKLITLTMVGDGEAETGPLATSWHSTKFLNPLTDGAVLPVLHLNGYKINNPTILARISHEELTSLFLGYGWTPYFVEGSDMESMHQAMAATLEHCVLEIKKYQQQARDSKKSIQTTLAHDRSSKPEGVDWSKKGRRQTTRGFLACTSNPNPRCCLKPRTSEDIGRMDEKLQAGRCLWQRWQINSGTEGTCTERKCSHECQPRWQWWTSSETSRYARLPQIRPS